MSKRAAGLATFLLAAILPVTMAAGQRGQPANLTPEIAVADHCAAWNTTDRVERERLLKTVFAADGVYLDPTPTYANGRAGLNDAIANFQRRNPGARFLCSAPQTHHRAMRVSWVMLGGDGKVREQGMDFYELGQDGLIRRVTGFFGPPPKVRF
jgi:hypothetical protein